MQKEHKKGLLMAFIAYLIWGLAPIYFKALALVPAHEILAHRIVWSVPFILLLLWLLKQNSQWRAIVRDTHLLKYLIASAFLVSANWFIFVWAVTAGRILDTSLGYFINPLFTIALGVVVLHEKLNRWQWSAVALAVVGVVWQIFVLGQLPWVSLGLAVTFGLYGLIRKRTPVAALDGLLIETSVLLPFALIYLVPLQVHESGQFGSSVSITLLLIFAGVITTVPLALFAAGARRIPLSTMGFLQYTSPTCTFFLALFVYHEPFDHNKLISFGCIWIGLLLLSIDNWRRR
jgi:chloramphenicol-sensitive protein RarD